MMDSLENDRFLRQNSEITIRNFGRTILIAVIGAILGWQGILQVMELSITDYVTPVLIGLLIGGTIFYTIQVSTRAIYQQNSGKVVEPHFTCNNCEHRFNHLVPSNCPVCGEDINSESVQQMIIAYYLTEDDLSDVLLYMIAGLTITAVFGTAITGISTVRDSAYVVLFPMITLFVLTWGLLKIKEPQFFEDNPYKDDTF